MGPGTTKGTADVESGVVGVGAEEVAGMASELECVVVVTLINMVTLINLDKRY